MSSSGARSSIGCGASVFSSKDQQQHTQQQPRLTRSQQQVAAFYRRVCEALQGEKAGVEELVKWAAGAYAGLVKGLDPKKAASVLKATACGAGTGAAGSGGGGGGASAVGVESKLEKFRSRGLTYSVRHISPAILRRQRADRSQSKDLSVLIDELKHHRDLWDSYLNGVKDSLGTGTSPEQKEAIIRKNDDMLFEIYRSLWPIVDKLSEEGADRSCRT